MVDGMNSVSTAAAESTCRKRVTVCAIYDAAGNTLACESNRCEPPNGQCTRMVVVNGKEGYPSTSTCNWSHAEQRAAKAVPEGAQATTAVLYGHDFLCGDCEAALKAIGVTTIHIVPASHGVGVRPEAA
jgi:deoxycytidylate deaminase